MAEQKKGGGLRLNLSKKFILSFLVLGVLLIAVLSLLINTVVRRYMEDQFADYAVTVADVVSEVVDGDTVAGYAQSLQTDAYYDKMAEFMRQVMREKNIRYVYVLVPTQDETGVMYIWSVPADDETWSEWNDLGYCEQWSSDDVRQAIQTTFSTGVSTDPAISNTAEYGYTASVYVPLYNAAGAVTALVGADLNLGVINERILDCILILVASLVITIALFLGVYLAALRRIIIRPINTLTQEARDFAEGGVLATFGDTIKTGDELQTLAEAFVKMAEDIGKYSQHLENTVADRERYATMMSFGSQMQLSMLPGAWDEDLKCLPYFDVAGYIKPAAAIGGDFYDYFVVDDRWLYLVICDVEKLEGIAAAFMVMVSKTIIKSQLNTGDLLADSVNIINQQVFDAVQEDGPVNAFLAVLDTLEGAFTYINAGYTQPLLQKSGQRYEWLECPIYSPLGMSENVAYRSIDIALHQGDRLLLYSDGVLRVRDRSGAAYPAEQLHRTVNELRLQQSDLKKTMESLESTLEIYAGAGAFDDDITMLCMEYKKGSRNRAELQLLPRADQVPSLTAFLKTQLAENGITGKAYAKAAVAAEELFQLCASATVGGHVSIQCEVADQSGVLVLRFASNMRGNPLEDETPAKRDTVAVLWKYLDSLYYEKGQLTSTLTMTLSCKE